MNIKLLTAIPALLLSAVLLPLPAQAQEEATEPPATYLSAELTLDSLPDKRIYRIGEDPDFTGLAVSVSTVSLNGERRTLLEHADPAAHPDMLNVTAEPFAQKAGQYTFTVSCEIADETNADLLYAAQSFTLTVTDLADVTLDGCFDSRDIIGLSRYLHGSLTLDHNAMTNADLDSDGAVDVFDLALLKRRLIGIAPDGEKPDYRVLATDATKAVTRKGWYKAVGDENTVILHDGSELLTFGNEYLQYGMTRALYDRYDWEFFQENVLILHMEVMKRADFTRSDWTPFDWTPGVADVTVENGQLVVIGEKTPCPENTYAREAVYLTQIALPKSQDCGSASWRYAGEETLDYSVDFVSGYAQLDEPVLVTNDKEWQTFRDTLDIDELDQLYPADGFENTALFLVSYDGLDDMRFVGASRDPDAGTVTVRAYTSSSAGDVVDSFVYAVALDKAAVRGLTPVLDYLYLPNQSFEGMSRRFDRPDASWYTYYPQWAALAVNVYSVDDTRYIGIYTVSHTGMVMFYSYKLEGAFELNSDYGDDVFEGAYEETANAAGDTIWQGKYYRITWGEDSARIEWMQNAADTERSIVIPYVPPKV